MKKTISKILRNFIGLFKARCTLIWVVTPEEQRAEASIIEAAAAAKYNTVLWDCATGLVDCTGQILNDAEGRDPRYIISRFCDPSDNIVEGRTVAIMRDLNRWLGPAETRALRSGIRRLQSQEDIDEIRLVVILTPSREIPEDLSGHTVMVQYPLPDREEITRILDDVLEVVSDDTRKAAISNGDRERAIDAAIGLSAEEAGNCYAKSLATSKRIDPVIVSAEKKQVIERSGVLSWWDPDPRGLDAVGGLELLKIWLAQRQLALGQRARDYGLPAPRGVLIGGIPGCGKSLVAKAVAAAWAVPLLGLDMGKIKSKYVGESENNLRKALAVAEAVSPCILWMDEIEKAMAGAEGPQGDGGVSTDALGAVLSWMQEHTGSVFVVATANDMDRLPAALLRRGRFDAIFFVDLPHVVERVSILQATLTKYGRKLSVPDLEAIAGRTDKFTGAELASLVEDGLSRSFADNERELRASDVVDAIGDVVPFAKTAAEKITTIREWASSRARPASAPQVGIPARKKRSAGVRTLDV